MDFNSAYGISIFRLLKSTIFFHLSWQHCRHVSRYESGRVSHQCLLCSVWVSLLWFRRVISQDHFKRLASVRLRLKDSQMTEIHTCLTGLLGLGAVVRAYPYDVPNFLPEVLMILSDHIHDSQPIQVGIVDLRYHQLQSHALACYSLHRICVVHSTLRWLLLCYQVTLFVYHQLIHLLCLQQTVKDVLSEFKRTHHDNWMDHKQKFTDDQLVVLTNLLVSPNYYAWITTQAAIGGASVQPDEALPVIQFLSKSFILSIYIWLGDNGHLNYGVCTAWD